MKFDHLAESWDEDPAKNERALIFARELIKLTKNQKGLKALEFGCGTGLAGLHLKDYFSHITMLDNSEGMLNVLRAKLKKHNINNIKTIMSDLINNGLNDINYDVIFSFLAIHHVSELDSLFSSFRKLLKKSGRLIIGELVSEDGSFHASHIDFKGHFGFEKDIFIKTLAAHGFDTDHYGILHTITKENQGVIRKYPLFIISCTLNIKE